MTNKNNIKTVTLNGVMTEKPKFYVRNENYICHFIVDIEINNTIHKFNFMNKKAEIVKKMISIYKKNIPVKILLSTKVYGNNIPVFNDDFFCSVTIKKITVNNELEIFSDKDLKGESNE